MPKLSRLFSKLTQRLLAACVALLPFLVFVESSLATTDLVSSPGALDAALGMAMMIFSFIIVVIVLLTYLFALGVGELLGSAFILDTGMGETLHLIWEVMRNFVNVAFILILLIIAVMVILKPGSEGGMGFLKKVLPKFILALVFVNLTFFAGRFILTTNDVLATAIFTLPKTVSGENMVKMPCDPNPATPEACRLEMIDYAKEALAGSNDLGTSNASVENYQVLLKKITKNLKSHKIADMVDKKNMALVLVTSMLDLEHLVHVKGLSGWGNVWDAAIGAIGSVIVAGAVGIIIFMLFLALIIRMVVLWLCIAISPLAALGIVMGDVIPGADMKGDFDLLDIFIKHAFMPTMVAVPLSIGLIMIFANNTAEFDSMGQIFSLSDGVHAGNFFSILWWIASIVIIWFGTNAMIKKASPKFADMITSKIHGGVNKFVGAAAGTLKYAPIVPTWGAPMAAMQKIQTAGRNRHAAAGGAMLKSSSLDKSWYEAPITETQVVKQTRDVAAAKDSQGAMQELEKLLKDLFNSSNGKTMLNTELSSDVVGRYNKLFETEVQVGTNLGDAIRKIVNGDIRSNLSNGQKDRLGGRLTMIESGEEKDLVELPPMLSKEETKKIITGQTNINSTEAGRNYEEGSSKGETKKDGTENIEVGGKVLHEVTVKDENGKAKTIYATQNDDKKSWTTAFTKAEFKKEMGNLRADIMTANDNTDMNAIGDRIAEFKTKYGNLAMAELKEIEITNAKAKANLQISLAEEHKIIGEEFEKIIK